MRPIRGCWWPGEDDAGDVWRGGHGGRRVRKRWRQQEQADQTCANAETCSAVGRGHQARRRCGGAQWLPGRYARVGADVRSRSDRRSSSGGSGLEAGRPAWSRLPADGRLAVRACAAAHRIARTADRETRDTTASRCRQIYRRAKEHVPPSGLAWSRHGRGRRGRADRSPRPAAATGHERWLDPLRRHAACRGRGRVGGICRFHPGHQGQHHRHGARGHRAACGRGGVPPGCTGPG